MKISRVFQFRNYEVSDMMLWVRTAMPGARDDAILACAQTEERLLVTLDKNFGELAFGMRLPAWKTNGGKA